MKKYLLIILALGAIVSCSKDEFKVRGEEEKPITFTAAALDGGDTKTYISGGKVNWVIGDEITISNGTSTGIYYIKEKSDSLENRMAIFTWKSGTKFTTQGAYTATYGNVNDQWYNAATPGSNCPMSATATTITPVEKEDEPTLCNFKFQNTCGVVAVKANTGSNKISRISIGGYSLNFSDPQSLDGTKEYLVAVPATSSASFSFTDVAFTDDYGMRLTKKLKNAAEVEINQIRKMNTGTTFNGSYTEYPDPLPGKFSVSSTKKVRFSPGNLYCDSSNTSSPIWRFEKNQYDYRTYQGKYSCINGAKSDTGTPNGHWGLFGWVGSSGSQGGKKIDEYGRVTVHYNDPYGQAAYGTVEDVKAREWGTAIQSSYSWRTLSKDDIEYIMKGRGGNCFAKAMVSGVYGIILFPDNYNGTTSGTGITGLNLETDAAWPTQSIPSETWKTMEGQGCVFLPSTGYRSGSNVNKFTEHHSLYWTGTGNGSSYAYVTEFHSESVSYYNKLVICKANNRAYGGNVRLVTDVVE